jgi:hypothetical protein
MKKFERFEVRVAASVRIVVFRILTLKMEAADSSQTFVIVYQTAWHNISQQRNLDETCVT